MMKPKQWTYMAAAAALQVTLLCAQPDKEKETAPSGPKPEPVLTAEDRESALKLEILPLPGEILSVLKQAKAADWAPAAEKARKPSELSSAKDSRLAAIALGMRVADAFLAIQAEDVKLLDQAAVEIFQAAAKLGATEEVLSQAAQVKSLAAAGKWRELTGPLDTTYQQAVKAMEDLGDTDSASIALTAGWLRGLDIFASQLSTSYSADASKALCQASLLETLEKKLASLPASTKEVAEIATMSKGLTALKPLVSGTGTEPVSEDTAKKIARIAKDSLPAK